MCFLPDRPPIKRGDDRVRSGLMDGCGGTKPPLAESDGPCLEVGRVNEGGASVVDCLPEAYLQAAHERLRLAGVRSPRVEAETLAAHVCSARLRKSTPSKLSPADFAAFLALVERRCQRVPLAHLTGRARFRELDLFVGPGVFVPQPETECLVHWAIGALHALVAAGHRHPLCVDLCTGSGTIALAIASEVPQASVHAVELDPRLSRLSWILRWRSPA